jgi:hypothetical protein
VHHRTIPNSQSRCDVWRVEHGANFIHHEVSYEQLIVAFRGDGVDLPRLCQGGRHAELDIPDKCFDCGEPPIASGRAVATLFLDVYKKSEYQRTSICSRQICDGLIPRRLLAKINKSRKAWA